MTDTAMLESKIKNSGIKKSYIAKELDISRTTLANKISNKSRFMADEVTKLGEILDLTDAEVFEIFLH